MSAAGGDAVRVIVFVGVAPDRGGRDANPPPGDAERRERVHRARPSFPGHDQPRAPAAPATGREALARAHGVDAFCHDVRDSDDARRLADALAHEPGGMPFCVRWVNPPAASVGEDDAARWIEPAARLFGDPRYVRVAGRPLLVVRHVPDADGSPALAALRAGAGRSDGERPFVAACEGPGDDGAVPPGCDAWVEMPPFHDRVATLNAHIAGLAPEFGGIVASQRSQVLLALRRVADGATRFRGVCPGWDDTPERGGQATVFVGSSPELFAFWVEAMVRDTRRRLEGDERLLFVNAWDDWLHGCALEPDVSCGAQYLDALKDGVDAGARLPVVTFDRPSAAVIASDLARAVASGELAVTTFGARPGTDAPGASVVMPVYNHVRFLDRTLASLAAQSALPLELVAVDDGSTDASAAAIERFARTSPFPVTLARQPNRGAHIALNRGLALARGSIVALLNSDDAFHPLRLERLVAALEGDGAFAFSDLELIDDDDRPVTGEDGDAFRATLAAACAHPTLLEALLARNVAVSSGNFVFRRSLVDAIGGFAALEVCHDWDFILAAALHARVMRVPEPLYRYRMHGSNTFAARGLAALLESERLLRSALAAVAVHPRIDASTRARIRAQLAARGQSRLWPS